jgi:hypothetical protein
MTRFTPTPTPHTGDENPGGTICQSEGFGLGEFAIFPTGSVRWRNLVSLQPAHPMGEAERNFGESSNYEAGGPFSTDPSSSSVIGKGILRGATFAQAGGPGGASLRKFFVAFNEVVFCSGPVPGGAGC